MKGLTDLRAVAAAPALEEFIAIDMPQLEPGAFRPLVRHSTLRRTSVYLGSHEKNRAVAELLGLPPVRDEFAKGIATGR